MLVSAVCLTYGRHELLEEALESWLRQDFSGHELLIYNTYSRHTLQFDHPNVRIINTYHRPKTLGETRNMAIEECKGEYILNWDDDDLYLPQYVSWLVKHLGDMDWARQSVRFCLNGTRIAGIAEQATNSTLFRKSLWKEVGGYPHMDSGEDKEFMRRVMTGGRGRKVPCKPAEIGFIYGFGRGPYNVSSCGRTRDGRNGLDEARRMLVKHMPRKGRIVLHPKWRQDYWAMTRRWLKENGHEA